MIVFVYAGTLPDSGPALHDPDPILNWRKMSIADLRALADRRAPLCCRCVGAYIVNPPSVVKEWLF